MSIETMTKLATTVLSANTASVTFSNIPQNYTDLKVLISGRTTGTGGRGYIVFSFNSSTGVYDRIWAAGFDGTQTTSARYTSETYGFFGTVPDANATASTFGNAQFYITNYTSNNLKSYTIDAVAENNSTGTYMLTLVAGSWDNTSALTSITFYAVGDGSLSSPTGSFLTHSTFTLYGVKAARTAVGNSIKAVGGNISFDGTYVSHTFNTSGTFTPSDSLRVDYLVVAGGGGGGSNNGIDEGAGGGGAGGLRSTVTATGGGGSLESSLTLIAGTSYTVTVGGGGAGGAQSGLGGAGTAGSNSVFSTITSNGGGGGAHYNVAPTGGGSGGGAAGNYTNPGSGTANQGFGGGSSSGSARGSGGGGAGATGVAAATSGNGGAGVATSITGSSVTYAGGGGGGGRKNTNVTTGGAGGAGGGGTGGNGGDVGSPVGSSGTVNTGSGGGGGGGAASAGWGGSGGSGVVVIRYRAVV